MLLTDAAEDSYPQSKHMRVGFVAERQEERPKQSIVSLGVYWWNQRIWPVAASMASALLV